MNTYEKPRGEGVGVSNHGVNQRNEKERIESAVGATRGTAQFLTHVVETALSGRHPVMVPVGWIVANVFLMPALQVSDPIAAFVHMKTDDLLQDARRRTHGLHSSIVRP